MPCEIKFNMVKDSHETKSAQNELEEAITQKQENVCNLIFKLVHKFCVGLMFFVSRLL